MSESPAPPPTSDERQLAGLAHLTGLFFALLIWAMQKDRSPFVRYQAMQAVAFDALSMIFFIGLSVVLAGAMILLPFLLVIVADSQGTLNSLPDWVTLVPGLLPLGLVGVMLMFFALWMGVRLWAAISCINGRSFHYPLVGRPLAALFSPNNH
jgi:uncharacterized Tic20 family protein